jgi:hypothetical protein
LARLAGRVRRKSRTGRTEEDKEKKKRLARWEKGFFRDTLGFGLLDYKAAWQGKKRPEASFAKAKPHRNHVFGFQGASFLLQEKQRGFCLCKRRADQKKQGRKAKGK